MKFSPSLLPIRFIHNMHNSILSIISIFLSTLQFLSDIPQIKEQTAPEWLYRLCLKYQGCLKTFSTFEFRTRPSMRTMDQQASEGMTGWRVVHCSDCTHDVFSLTPMALNKWKVRAGSRTCSGGRTVGTAVFLRHEGKDMSSDTHLCFGTLKYREIYPGFL